jgi:hypothetical protein
MLDNIAVSERLLNTLTRNNSQLDHHQAAALKPTMQLQQLGLENVGQEGLHNTH